MKGGCGTESGSSLSFRVLSLASPSLRSFLLSQWTAQSLTMPLPSVPLELLAFLVPRPLSPTVERSRRGTSTRRSRLPGRHLLTT